MGHLLGCAAAAALLFGSAPAQAAWQVAKSKHFIIYADENPRRLHDFAEKLERFDQAARLATRMDDPPVGDGNRLTVFVLPRVSQVRELAGDKKSFLAGFYTGDVRGSRAYLSEDSLRAEHIGDAIFYHEYSHHLMKQDLSHPYPEWYVEGFAEFFSTPKFDKDGSVWFGQPVQGRAGGLFFGPQLPLETLLAGMQPGMSNEKRDVFYGRGWLLTHYLTMSSTRRGQLATYIAALSNGVAPLAAAQQAFGDLKQLDRELDGYRRKPLLQFQIAGSRIHIAPVSVAPLNAGGAEAIPLRARLKNRVSGADAEALAAQLRQLQAKYPGDELVETTLAEAELEAGHAQAAEAAAARALKANPRSTEAMVLKGRAMAERADAAEDASRGALFDQARAALIAANKLDTEDPEPLFEYYRTYLKEGRRPTDNALAALHYASDLAPQDLSVRMNSAIAYLNEGKPKEARSTLIVVAYSPHVGDMGDTAKAMIAAIDAGNPKAALEELGRSRRSSGQR